MNTELLKKKILQLAMQGKLVEQDESDGTADELIDQILEEKEKLMSEGKIKKEKLSRIYKNPTDNHYYEKFEDGTEKDISKDISFDIPQTWIYTRLKNIGTVVGGGTPKTDVKENWENATIPWVTPADMKNIKGLYVKRGERNISTTGLSSSSAKLLPAGSILFSSRAPIGYIAIAENDICTNQGFKSLVLIKKELKFFLYYQLIQKTPEIIHRASGTTFKEISGTEFGETIVAIPPLNEQIRIVTKLNMLFEKINKINKKYLKINKLKNILRTKIIDVAIRGKFTKQLLTDESASNLIEDILKEKRMLIKECKIKKENLSIIYKDTDNQFYEKFDDGKIINITNKIPFSIPNNWSWTRLKNIFKFINGDRGKNYPSKEKLLLDGKIPFISAINMENNSVKKEGLLFVSDEQYNKLRTGKLQKNDFVFCIRGSLGKHCKYNYDTGAIASSLVILRKIGEILDDYISLYLDSPLIIQEINSTNNGTAQPNLGARDVMEYLIPIPPLNEQFRIISKINQIRNIL